MPHVNGFISDENSYFNILTRKDFKQYPLITVNESKKCVASMTKKELENLFEEHIQPLEDTINNQKEKIEKLEKELEKIENAKTLKHNDLNMLEHNNIEMLKHNDVKTLEGAHIPNIGNVCDNLNNKNKIFKSLEGRQKTYSDEDAKHMKALKKQGISYKKIAEIYDCSATCIRDYVNDKHKKK